MTERTPPSRAPPGPAPLPASRTLTRARKPPAALRTYVIVAPLPEVEGPDGPEEQQRRPRNEDHGSDLEQPRGAGGLHGHRGVRLRAGSRGTVMSARSDPARRGWRTARPGLLRAPPFAALASAGPWSSGVDVR